jgi:hypothetical protein
MSEIEGSIANFEALKSTCIHTCLKIISELEIDIPLYRSKYGVSENEDLSNTATVN